LLIKVKSTGMIPIIIAIARTALLSPRVYMVTLAALRFLQRRGQENVTMGQIRDALITAGYGDIAKQHLCRMAHVLDL